VTPPDANGLCSLGVSVDIVKSAVANARYIIAQVNNRMPRTFGDSFVHANHLDMLVPFDQDIIELPVPQSDEVLRRIGQNIARLIEDGSTIECGIGRVPQALAEFLKDKKDLGVHTEMFSDWIIDLIECGAITCAKKTLNRDKVVASFCMGSERLYRYIDNNPFFEFYPTEYVNDLNIISQHEKMVGINVGLEIDLTGQVCADSLGYQFYSGFHPRRRPKQGRQGNYCHALHCQERPGKQDRSPPNRGRRSCHHPRRRPLRCHRVRNGVSARQKHQRKNSRAN
jgi:acyl-CoA hydrolase